MPETLWVRRRPDELSLRDWPDGTVAYDEGSGQLNCLGQVHGELLRLMCDGRSWTATTLAAEFLQDVPTAEDIEMIENAIGEFYSLQFIDRVTT